MTFDPHLVYTYRQPQRGNDDVEVIYQEKSDIWMRIVRYPNSEIGIQVCPSKQEINGSPVWQIYNDSVPATRAMAYFVSRLNIDYLLRFDQMTRELGQLEGDKARIEQDLRMEKYKVEQLNKKLLDAHSSLDALTTDMNRMLDKDPLDRKDRSSGSPYR